MGDKLKALSEAASQGRWTVEDVNVDDVQRPTRFAGPCVVYSDEDCETHPVADCSCNHTCRDDAQVRANAEFIVELVNAYRDGRLIPAPGTEGR